MSELERKERYQDYVDANPGNTKLTYMLCFGFGGAFIISSLGIFVMDLVGNKVSIDQFFNKYSRYKTFDTDTRLFEKKQSAKISADAVESLAKSISTNAYNLKPSAVTELTKIVNKFLKENCKI